MPSSTNAVWPTAASSGPAGADEESERLLREPYVAALRHEELPFVSYPYEWSFGMLQQAALTTLG